MPHYDKNEILISRKHLSSEKRKKISLSSKEKSPNLEN
jgi:hypothetical protein